MTRDALARMFDRELEELNPNAYRGFPGGTKYEQDKREADTLEARLRGELTDKQRQLLNDFGDALTAAKVHEMQVFYRVGFIRGLTVMEGADYAIVSAGCNYLDVYGNETKSNESVQTA